MILVHEPGFHRGEGSRSEGTIVRRGLIVGILGFLWLRGGSRLFRGGGGITVDVRAQGVILRVGIHEVFACEVGVVQGARDHSGQKSDRGGVSEEI